MRAKKRIRKRPFTRSDVYKRQVVDGIIADVRARGDDALKDYALKFDGAKIDALQAVSYTHLISYYPSF